MSNPKKVKGTKQTFEKPEEVKKTKSFWVKPVKCLNERQKEFHWIMVDTIQ